MTGVAKLVRDFFEQYSFVRLPKKTVLLLPDQPVDHVWYLISGSVEQYAITEAGDRVVVNVFNGGAFFPIAYIMPGSRNGFFFEVSEDAVAYIAPAQDVLTLLRTNHDVLFDLLGRVYRGADGLLQQMVELMSGTARSVLVRRLVIEARRVDGDAQRVVLPISEATLASRTGLSRETVSRELVKLREAGLIEQARAKVTIVDVAALDSWQ